MNTKRHPLIDFFLLLTVLVSPAANATAGTRRHDVADSEHLTMAALPEFASVGKITTTSIFGSNTGSGVLIDDQWVLTAAHVFVSITAPPSGITFTINGTNYTAAEWIPHTLWSDNAGISINGYDIGLVRLTTPVVGVTPAVRYTGSSELGNTATIVGFGNTGTGLTGQQLGTAGTKRAGPNTIDAFGSHFGFATNHLLYDFDNPTLPADSHFGSSTPLPLEYSAAQGDSGGGVFINDGGVQKVAGITSYGHPAGPDGSGRPFAGYGTTAGSTRVSSLNGWVDSVMSGEYQASQRTWNNASGGSFTTSSNWSEGSAPGADGRAIFDVFGPYTVTLPGNVTNNQIVVRRGDITFDLGGNTYTLDNPTFDASIAVTHPHQSNSKITFTNGVVQAINVFIGSPGFAGTAALQINPGASLQASALEISGTGTLTLNGDPSTVGSLNLLNGSTITGSGQLTVTTGPSNWTGGSMTGTGTTTLVNGTTLNLDGSSDKFVSRTLNNAGTINWAGSGAIGGSGVINNQVGAIIDAKSNASFTSGGTFNNAGTLRKSAGAGTTTVGWRLTNTGTVQAQVGTLTLASSLASGSNHTGTFTVSAGATLNFSGGVHNISAGSILTGSGALALSGATLSIAGDNNFNNFSSFSWSGGTFSGTGTTTVGSGSVFNISGTGFKTLQARTITNNGTINWAGTGGVTLSGSAVINNQTGALFDAKDNATLGGFPATINNAGTFRKSAGTGTSSVQTPFNNTGAVEAQVGTLSFDEGGTHTGSFSVSSGATLNFGNGIHSFNSGANITGAGTLGFSAGIVTIAASMLNQTGPVTIGASVNLGITGDNTFNNLTWNGGTLSGTGTSTIASGAVANVNGGNLNGRFLTNAGTLNWTGSSISASSNAVINNQLGGLIDAKANGTSSANTNNAGTFRKSTGTGITTLNGALNNSGTVEVQTGTLKLASSPSFNNTHSGAFNVSPGATLEFNGGIHNLNAGSNLAGAGTVLISGATVNLANTMINVTGPIQLNSGSFAVTGDYGLTSNFFWNGGTFGGSGNTTVAIGEVYNIGGASTRTLAGRTLVNNGTITRSSGGIFQGSEAVINNTVGSLIDLQSDFGFGGGFTSINNAGTVRKSSGAGTSVINSNFINTGGVEVQTGALIFGHNGTHSSTFNVASGAELGFSSGTHTFNAGSNLTGAGTVANHSATLNVAGSMLNATGLFAFNGGTLNVTGDNTFSNINWATGTLQGAGTTTITGTMNLTGFNNRNLIGRTLTNAGTINVQDGVGTIGNGATIHNQLGAVFNMQANVSLLWSLGVQPTFNNAGTFKKSAGASNSFVQWIFNNSGTVRSEVGNIQLNGPFTQTPSGRIVLAGGNVSSTNTLSIAAGSLEGTGTVAANTQINGTISPGLSAGRLTFTGNLTLQSNAQTEIELGGLTAGTLFDQIVVNGAASLGGLLEVSLIDAGMGMFAPGIGDVFEILTASGGVTGSFAPLPPLPSGYEFDVLYEANRVLLEVIQIGESLPGDFNSDGTVDAADYVVWRKNPGGIYTPADFNTWSAHFGQTAGSGATGFASDFVDPPSPAVPEPSTLAMLLVGVLLLSPTRERVINSSIADTHRNMTDIETARSASQNPSMR